MARCRKILVWMLEVAVGVLVAEMIWPSVYLEYLGIIYTLPVMMMCRSPSGDDMGVA